MHSIIFDLETTDRNFIGQILNCCFIEVDESWNEVSRFEGAFRISPLQLPSAGAILANRTPVMDHQRSAPFTEPEGLRKVAEYLEGVIERNPGERVPLLGYNSSKFDIPYLRTSLIRNGINPYFGGKIVNRDVLHGIRYLSATRTEFPRRPHAVQTPEEPPRLSLALETITRAFGLLDGAQAHHSSADVELTIALCKELQARFGFDARRYEAYDGRRLHDLARGGRILCGLGVEYSLESAEIAQKRPLILLHHDNRSGLWVDLDRYRERQGRDAIQWCGTASSWLEAVPHPTPTKELEELAASARKEFSALRVDNFFEETTCDVELDIYRVDFDGIRVLHEAIWDANHDAVRAHPRKEVRVLFVRHQMNKIDWSGARSERERELLRRYVEYRYGGMCNVSKSHRGELATADGSRHPAAHETIAELVADVERRLSEPGKEGDRELLLQLKEFYAASPLLALVAPTARAAQSA